MLPGTSTVGGDSVDETRKKVDPQTTRKKKKRWVTFLTEKKEHKERESLVRVSSLLTP